MQTLRRWLRARVPAGELLIADSAEEKSVSDYRSYGLNCRASEKGPGSVAYSMKWLQSLAAIVIDPGRCQIPRKNFLNTNTSAMERRARCCRAILTQPTITSTL